MARVLIGIERVQTRVPPHATFDLEEGLDLAPNHRELLLRKPRKPGQRCVVVGKPVTTPVVIPKPSVRRVSGVTEQLGVPKVVTRKMGKPSVDLAHGERPLPRLNRLPALHGGDPLIKGGALDEAAVRNFHAGERRRAGQFARKSPVH